MSNEDLETPATVVIVPQRRNAGRARVVKSDLTLAGAVRFVAERMEPAERPRAVIRTPTRSLLIDEITALYKRDDVQAAPAEADFGRRAPAEPRQDRSATADGPEMPTETTGRSPWALPRAALQRTAIRFVAAGLVALGVAGAAGLVADYCRSGAGPPPAKIAVAVRRVGSEACDEPRTRTACPGPVASVPDHHAGTSGEDESSPAAGISSDREVAEAVPGGHEAKPRPVRLADRATGPSAPKGVRRQAALPKAAPSRRPRKFARSYPSMRVGARHVMLDPIALSGGRYN